MPMEGGHIVRNRRYNQGIMDVLLTVKDLESRLKIFRAMLVACMESQQQYRGETSREDTIRQLIEVNEDLVADSCNLRAKGKKQEEESQRAPKETMEQISRQEEQKLRRQRRKQQLQDVRRRNEVEAQMRLLSKEHELRERMEEQTRIRKETIQKRREEEERQLREEELRQLREDGMWKTQEEKKTWRRREQEKQHSEKRRSRKGRVVQSPVSG